MSTAIFRREILHSQRVNGLQIERTRLEATASSQAQSFGRRADFVRGDTVRCYGTIAALAVVPASTISSLNTSLRSTPEKQGARPPYARNDFPLRCSLVRRALSRVVEHFCSVSLLAVAGTAVPQSRTVDGVVIAQTKTRSDAPCFEFRGGAGSPPSRGWQKIHRRFSETSLRTSVSSNFHFLFAIFHSNTYPFPIRRLPLLFLPLAIP